MLHQHAYLSPAALDAADAILQSEALWTALLSGRFCFGRLVWDLAGPHDPEWPDWRKSPPMAGGIDR